MRQLIPGQDLKDEFGITITERQRRRLEAEGKFPQRVKVSERSHAYVTKEIEAFVKAKIADRS